MVGKQGTIFLADFFRIFLVRACVNGLNVSIFDIPNRKRG